MGSAADAARPPSTLWQWVRHHLSSVAATAVDYTLMIVCVEAIGLLPVPATVVGAFAGAATNFTLNRIFTYRVRDVAVRHQTWRYVIVSGASLALNAAGEKLFCDVLGLHYFVARVITSVIVSNTWNYPLQRFFVFSRGRDHEGPPPPSTEPPRQTPPP